MLLFFIGLCTGILLTRAYCYSLIEEAKQNVLNKIKTIEDLDRSLNIVIAELKKLKKYTFKLE